MARWKKRRRRARGRLASISAEELGSIAIKGALEKTGTEPSEVDHAIMGHALQTSSQAIFGARRAGILSGIPHQVPMLTINRLCGSGAQSVVSVKTDDNAWRGGDSSGRRNGEPEPISSCPQG